MQLMISVEWVDATGLITGARNARSLLLKLRPEELSR
jgi:hypothetical protein